MIASVANGYYTLLSLDKQLRVYDETILLWTETVRTMEEMMEAGSTNLAAVTQSRANLYSAQAAREDILYNIPRYGKFAAPAHRPTGRRDRPRHLRGSAAHHRPADRPAFATAGQPPRRTASRGRCPGRLCQDQRSARRLLSPALPSRPTEDMPMTPRSASLPELSLPTWSADWYSLCSTPGPTAPTCASPRPSRKRLCSPLRNR